MSESSNESGLVPETPDALSYEAPIPPRESWTSGAVVRCIFEIMLHRPGHASDVRVDVGTEGLILGPAENSPERFVLNLAVTATPFQVEASRDQLSRCFARI